MPNLSIKVYYEPKGDIRRLSFSPAEFTFQNVRRAVVRNYFPPSVKEEAVVLKYKDDEGDWITIASDAELRDGMEFKSAKDSLLRLRAALVETPGTPCPSPSLPSPSPALPETLPGLAALNTCVRSIKDTFSALSPAKAAVGEGRTRTCAHPWFTWRLNYAVGLMDRNKWEDAEKVLLQLSKHHPDQPLPFYNLACIHARRKHVSAALDCLERAVSCGYDDGAWLAQDPDLEHVRDQPRFQEMVRRVRAMQVVPSAPVEERPGLYPRIEEAEEGKGQGQGTGAAELYRVQLELLRDMGLSDEEENVRLLTRFQGDITQVIHTHFAK